MDLTIERGYAGIVTVLVTIVRSIVGTVFVGVVGVISPVDAAIGNEDVRLERDAAIGGARIHRLSFAIERIKSRVDPGDVHRAVRLVYRQPGEELRRAEIVVVDFDPSAPGAAPIGRADDVGVDVRPGGRARGKVREGDVKSPEEGRVGIPINVYCAESVDAALVLCRRKVVRAEGLKRGGGGDRRGRPGGDRDRGGSPGPPAVCVF